MGQRVVDDIDNAEQEDQLDDRRQAAAHRVVAVGLIELHQLFLLFFLIIGVFFLDFLNLRLEDLHFGAGLLLFDA